MNETEAIRTLTNVIVETPSNAAKQYRTRSLLMTHPVVYAFAQPITNPGTFKSSYKTSYVGLSADLPLNIHLQTFRALGNGFYVFRLRHLYGLGEDVKFLIFIIYFFFLYFLFIFH